MLAIGHFSVPRAAWIIYASTADGLWADAAIPAKGSDCEVEPVGTPRDFEMINFRIALRTAKHCAQDAGGETRIDAQMNFIGSDSNCLIVRVHAHPLNFE